MEFPLKTIQLVGYPHVWTPPIYNIYMSRRQNQLLMLGTKIWVIAFLGESYCFTVFSSNQH